MATASVLVSDSLKFALSSRLGRPLAHKPFLIPCRPSPRARSLTVKARRFSKFNDASSFMNERLTIFSNLTEKDSPLEPEANVLKNTIAEAQRSLLNPAILIVMVTATAVMFWAFNPTFVRNNINTAIVHVVTTFTLKAFSVLLLLTFTVIVILLALLFVVSLFLLCRTITLLALPHILREAIFCLLRPVRYLLSPLSVMTTSRVKTSVFHVKAHLLDKGKSFEKDVNRVVKVADSSSFLLTEILVALLRRLDCCTSGHSSVNVKQIMEDGEKHFNQLSNEERASNLQYTLINVNGTKEQNTMSHRAFEYTNEYIVISILVVAKGVYNLPYLNSRDKLKKALQELGSIPANKIHTVEVIWTPGEDKSTWIQGLREF